MKKLIFLLMIISSLNLFSQKDMELRRVEPPFWWTGMAVDTLQLMVYGENIGSAEVKLKGNAASIIEIHKADSPNYLFIDLKIKAKATSNFDLQFLSPDGKIISYKYFLKQKQWKPQGFSAKDIVYLLMPDRFANGDITNDNAPGMLEKANRKNPDGRHGGDIAGIIQHVDYLKNIGITTVWATPLLENNRPDYSYHGYGITDFYKIDPRLGTNELYVKLSETIHNQGLKLIQDVVYNHCGEFHWWNKDLPFKDWYNTNPNFRTNYRVSVTADVHASQYDKQHFNAGWFVEIMPDLNQRNKFLSNYLIQNTLWWIEFARIDGLRIDTYAYSFPEFTFALTKRLKQEYPTLAIFGEVWAQKEAFTAYYQQGSRAAGNFKSGIDRVTDFPLSEAIKAALNSREGWTTGSASIYYVLAQDFLYKDANKNVIFLDNHDVDRFFSVVGKNTKKFKAGLALLMTLRGMPVVYYGTEIAMSGLRSEGGDAQFRKDMPGGWKNDTVSVFSAKNLTKKQVEVLEYFTKLANWRKNNDVVAFGKLVQFIPENDIYVFFRILDDKAVMVIFNNSSKRQNVNTEKFSEILQNFSRAKSVTNNKIYNLDKAIPVNGKTVLILDLQ